MENCTGLMRLCVASVLIVSVVCSRLPLPSYIIPCSRSNRDLNDCALRNGRLALPDILQGDTTYNIPSLNPLKVERLDIDRNVSNFGVEMEIQNMEVYGFTNVSISAVRFDLLNKTMAVDMFTPRLLLKGRYNMRKGRYMYITFRGNGTFEITQENVDFKFTMTYDLVTKPDGLEYLVPNESQMTFTNSFVHFLFENIANGNKELSDTINRHMNKNWKKFMRSLGPSIADNMGQVLTDILRDTFDRTPYKEVFVD